MRLSAVVILFLVATLAGCSKKASTAGQNATLTLQDGTTVVGTVTKSDPSSITIRTPTGIVSTYPMSQVSAINYAPNPGVPANPPIIQPPPQQAATASQQPPAAPAPVPSDSNAPPQTSSAPPAPVSAAVPPSSPPEQQHVPAETFQTIPAGRTITVRTDQSIDSSTAADGQTYPGSVARDVLDSSGRVAIPRGSRATLVVRDARAQGKVEGRSELVLDIAAVQVGAHHYRLETSAFVKKGREGVGANQRTAKFAGGGGLLGGIIGAVAGGGRGAAIGALAGAAAGTGAETATRGKAVRIPAETLLDFRLEAPIRVREMH